MDIGQYMGAIAQVIDQKKHLIGLEGVSYPAINYVPASPWVMVRQSLTAPGQVAKARAGLQMVEIPVDLVVLVASNAQQPDDAARLDTVLHPLLDLFDANAHGGNVNYAFSGVLTESVDRVWNTARPRRAVLDWGETGFCHALIITLDSAFQRRAFLP